MNEVFLFTEIIATFICMLLAYKLFNKKGLIVWMVLSLCISFLMSLKIINFIYFDVNLGIVMYVSNFVAINILIQKYGKKDLMKYIIICCASLSLLILFIYLSTKFDYSFYNLASNLSYNMAFSINLQFALAFLVAYVISSFININIYYYLRTTRNNILISNCYSSIMVFFFDSIIFAGLAFVGGISLLDLIVLIIVSTVIKYIVAWMGTFLLYITNRIG